MVLYRTIAQGAFIEIPLLHTIVLSVEALLLGLDNFSYRRVGWEDAFLIFAVGWAEPQVRTMLIRSVNRDCTSGFRARIGWHCVK